MRLLPSLAPAPPAWASRLAVASPDGMPVCSDVPGFEPGRVVLLTGELRHALALSIVARDMLDCVAPADARMMPALSATRKPLAEAAQAQAAAATAAKQSDDAAAEAAEEEERRRRDGSSATDESMQLVQGRARRNERGGGDEFTFLPRAPRRLQ